MRSPSWKGWGAPGASFYSGRWKSHTAHAHIGQGWPCRMGWKGAKFTVLSSTRSSSNWPRPSVKSSDPFMRRKPSGPVASQRSHLSASFYWGLSFQHTNFGGHIETMTVPSNSNVRDNVLIMDCHILNTVILKRSVTVGFLTIGWFSTSKSLIFMSSRIHYTKIEQLKKNPMTLKKRLSHKNFFWWIF